MTDSKMGKFRSSSRSRRGSALVMCLVGVMGMAGLSMLLIAQSLGSSREYSNRFEDDQAMMVARAGLAEAVTALRLGGSGQLGSEATPVAHHTGLYWVDSTEPGDGTTVLTVTALDGAGRCSLEAVLETSSGPLFVAALFENDGLEIQPSSFVDSFDSTEGSYADQIAAGGGAYVKANGAIRSNGGISVGNNGDIYGDATPGPGQTASGGNISGSTAAATETVVLPSINVPSIASTGSLTVAQNKTVTLSAGDYNYSSIELKSKATLIVEGGTRIVVGSFDVGSNGNVVLGDSDGNCEIYASGDVYFSPNSTIETPAESGTAVSIYLTGDEYQTAQFKPKGLYYGTVYGPNATVEVYPSFELFGAIVAGTLKVQPGARFHFDEALLAEESDIGDLALLYCRRVEFTSKELARNRIDPIHALGLEGQALLTSAEAIEKACLQDEYDGEESDDQTDGGKGSDGNDMPIEDPAANK